MKSDISPQAGWDDDGERGASKAPYSSFNPYANAFPVAP
jgi:hypothetical protein